MKQLAFDLDGVFISDLKFENNLKTFLYWRNNQFPIFTFNNINITPVFITGRPNSDEELTNKWITNNITDNFVLYTNPLGLKQSVNHKLNILNNVRQDINIFIESCPLQAEYLIKNIRHNCKIILFSSLIETSINSLIYES